MIAQGWLGRPVSLDRAISLGRPRPRLILLALALGLLLGAWLWLRDSALVSVDRVTVSGVGGPDSAQIRSALVSAGRSMTTLDVRTDQLRMAVVPFPVVKDLQVSTQFPHGLRIRVIEQIPVGAVVVGGRTIAVAGDGTLLHDMVPSPSLPTIPLTVPPGGSRLSEPAALHAVALLAAAPYQLLTHIGQVSTVPSHGLVAQLRNGPSIYFGDAGRLGAKWLAAAAVLADAGSNGAMYIDVTDPERPAAGAGAGASSGPAPGVGTGPPGAAGTAASQGARGAGGASVPGGSSLASGPSSAASAPRGSATTPAGGAAAAGLPAPPPGG